MQPRTSLLTVCFTCSLVILFSSCLTSRKIDKWVDKKYDETLSTPTKKSPDYISISTSLSTSDKKNSTTQKTTNKLLPLLFYWKFHFANTCTLNPKLPVNNFTNTVISYAGSKGLKRKLNGQRVELTIDQLPNAFAIDDDGYMVFVVLYMFGQETISVQPVKTDMVVQYRIMQQDGSETKKGTITIPDANKGIYLKMLNSTKRKTWEYLDTYNDNISLMSKKMVDQLLAAVE